MTSIGFWKSTSQSIIVGVPVGFNLVTALSKARVIKMAVAFMNEAGLKMFLDAIPDPTGIEFEVMVGLGFGLTHPKALKTLLNIQKQFKRTNFRIILPNKHHNVFHPKVIVIYDETDSFALVGSANCTGGGYDGNYECTVYVDSPTTIKEIEVLIDGLRDSSKQYLSRPLTSKLIADYEKQWAKMKQPVQRLNELDQDTDEELTKEAIIQIQKWDDLVKAAKRFTRNEWSNSRSAYEQAVSNIKACLNYPNFTNITYSQWQSFYEEGYLGRLIPIRRDVIFREIDKLSEQLRQLINENILLADRVDKMLMEEKKIYGVGINLVTKILTCHDPDKYPTWNNPVISALSDFGFELPRGATKGRKYAAFQKIMEDLKNEAGLENMLALDAFLYSYSGW